MTVFDEHYRVIGVAQQRLVIRGVQSGEVLTIKNGDPENPITEEDYPLGTFIALTDPSMGSPAS